MTSCQGGGQVSDWVGRRPPRQAGRPQRRWSGGAGPPGPATAQTAAPPRPRRPAAPDPPRRSARAPSPTAAARRPGDGRDPQRRGWRPARRATPPVDQTEATSAAATPSTVAGATSGPAREVGGDRHRRQRPLHGDDDRQTEHLGRHRHAHRWAEPGQPARQARGQRGTPRSGEEQQPQAGQGDRAKPGDLASHGSQTRTDDRGRERRQPGPAPVHHDIPARPTSPMAAAQHARLGPDEHDEGTDQHGEHRTTAPPQPDEPGEADDRGDDDRDIGATDRRQMGQPGVEPSRRSAPAASATCRRGRAGDQAARIGRQTGGRRPQPLPDVVGDAEAARLGTTWGGPIARSTATERSAGSAGDSRPTTRTTARQRTSAHRGSPPAGPVATVARAPRPVTSVTERIPTQWVCRPVLTSEHPRLAVHTARTSTMARCWARSPTGPTVLSPARH